MKKSIPDNCPDALLLHLIPILDALPDTYI